MNKSIIHIVSWILILGLTRGILPSGLGNQLLIQDYPNLLSSWANQNDSDYWKKILKFLFTESELKSKEKEGEKEGENEKVTEKDDFIPDHFALLATQVIYLKSFKKEFIKPYQSYFFIKSYRSHFLYILLHFLRL